MSRKGLSYAFIAGALAVLSVSVFVGVIFAYHQVIDGRRAEQGLAFEWVDWVTAALYGAAWAFVPFALSFVYWRRAKEVDGAQIGTSCEAVSGREDSKARGRSRAVTGRHR